MLESVVRCCAKVRRGTVIRQAVIAMAVAMAAHLGAMSGSVALGMDAKEVTVDRPVHAGHGSSAAAADSLDYGRFAQVLRRHLPERLVQDIISKLPSNSKVYGFDVGDISGDSLSDVMLSVKPDAAKQRELEILLFVRMSDRMERAATLRKRYVGEPIEVGFAVENGVCRVTQKLAEYAWNITGYTVDQLVFQESDAWNTHRVEGSGYGAYGVETVDDYRTLRSTEIYYRLSDARTVLKSAYTTLPAFPVGRPVPPMLRRELAATTAHGLLSGSSSWFGDDDCSFRVVATWDSTTVTLHIAITDERILFFDATREGDHLEIHLDRSGKPRIAPNGRARSFSTDERISLLVAMRDDEVPPRIEVASDVSERLALLLRQCTIERQRSSDGVQHLVLRMPREILPNRSAMPFTLVYRDVDNPEHPEWVTVRATSEDFDAGQPASYGRLDLIAWDASRLEVEDLRLVDVRARLHAVGVLR